MTSSVLQDVETAVRLFSSAGMKEAPTLELVAELMRRSMKVAQHYVGGLG